VAILAAIALPSFQDSLRSNRAATTTNSMLASLSLARSEAIRNNRTASICPSADGAACGADWSAGWLVWEDVNLDNTVNAGEAVLRFSQGSDRMVVQSSAAVLRFDSRGRRALPTGAGAGTITLQPDACGGNNYRRTLSIGATGQVRKDGALGVCI
jgi:type IV fimbrial biogenesis protein FimT